MSFLTINFPAENLIWFFAGLGLLRICVALANNKASFQQVKSRLGLVLILAIWLVLVYSLFQNYFSEPTENLPTKLNDLINAM